MQNIIFALTAKNIQFDDDLRYSNPECPPSCNDPNTLEQALQKITKENLAIFNRFKEMTRLGNHCPILIDEDKI